MTEQQIRKAVVDYIRKTGCCPNFRTIGTTWDEAVQVYRDMLADGTLVWEVKTSPKGRKTRVIRLGESR